MSSSEYNRDSDLDPIVAQAEDRARIRQLEVQLAEAIKQADYTMQADGFARTRARNEELEACRETLNAKIEALRQALDGTRLDRIPGKLRHAIVEFMRDDTHPIMCIEQSKVRESVRDALVAAPLGEYEQRVRRETLEEACKVMCVDCEEGTPMCRSACPVHGSEPHHWHEPHHRKCRAAAIRELADTPPRSRT